jgi:hypothetical protein
MISRDHWTIADRTNRRYHFFTKRISGQSITQPFTMTARTRQLRATGFDVH